MDRDKIVRFHEETAACWRAKGQPAIADAHAERAKAVSDGADLSKSELAGSEYGMMADAAESVAKL